MLSAMTEERGMLKRHVEELQWQLEDMREEMEERTTERDTTQQRSSIDISEI